MIIVPLEMSLVLAANDPDYKRTPGLHMSDIYNDLFKHLEPERYDKRDEAGNPIPFDEVRMEAGMAFETMLEQGFKRRLGNRPGEFTTPEGIIFSPDGLTMLDAAVLFDTGVSTTGDDLFVDEFKATWMSARYLPVREDWIGTLLPRDFKSENVVPAGAAFDDGVFPEKFDKWFVQMMAYCENIGTPFARLFVYFVDGDYSRPFQPVVLPYAFRFSDAERKENWNMLRNHARSMGALVQTPAGLIVSKGWLDGRTATA